MKKYELVTILEPNIAEDEAGKIIDATQKVILDTKGEIVEIDKWGKRDLASSFKKHSSGFYFLVKFTGDNSTLEKVNQLLKVNERVIRHMVSNFVEIKEPVAKKK